MRRFLFGCGASRAAFEGRVTWEALQCRLRTFNREGQGAVYLTSSSLVTSTRRSREPILRSLRLGGQVRRYFLACLIIPALAAAQDPHAAHQQAAPSPLSKDEMVAFVKAELAISTARDSMQAQYAMVRNKKVEVLNSLREKLRLQIDSILKKAGMTQADFDKK